MPRPPFPLRPVLQRLGLWSAQLCFLAACTTATFQLDRSATAPHLEGFGHVQMATSVRSPAALALFEQGMAQAYAFNEVEAVRAFKAALAQDPHCAPCAWGVAYQLGPNINNTDRGDLKEALAYVDLALKEAEGASPRERQLIEALALRYAHGSEARNTAPLQGEICGASKGGGQDDRPHPLDVAYAERMRELANRYPDDPDILSMYAEAEMIATTGDWWDRQTGRPAGRMGEVAERLEAALARHPQHTGLNHYLIHAVDAVQVAHRAVAAADRLGALAPNSPHLIHMPAHTYVQVGRYADATRVNQQALEADTRLTQTLDAQHFKPSKNWRYHNGHFQWYGALMEGRGDLALQSAREAAARATADHEYHEYQRSLPMLTLVRFERWSDILKEPMPSGDKGVAALLGEMARGMALAHTGKPEEATAAQDRVDTAAAGLLRRHSGRTYIPRMMRSLAQTAQAQLRATRAQAAHDLDQALLAQAEAVKAAYEVDGTEPPMLAAGSRLALGELQLQAGKLAEAERSFRDDLVQHPHSGWALRGLEQSLRRAGKASDAAQARAELQRDWALADAALLASTAR